MGEEKRVLRLGVETIRPNPRQPRRLFDEGALRELAASIRRHGVVQPLVVRRRPDGWELVAGERRLRAARLAGLAAVPCVEAEVDERESALLALVENLQRQDLHYFEEAAAIADYLRRTGATQEEAAAQLGRSPSAVANKLRLLRLSPACQALLLETGLTERHARALLRLEDQEERLAAARRAAARKLNVAQTERGPGSAHRTGGRGGGPVPPGGHGGGNCHDDSDSPAAGELNAPAEGPVFLLLYCNHFFRKSVLEYSKRETARVWGRKRRGLHGTADK